jgi:RNA polymerase-binding transcription factor DksA
MAKKVQKGKPAKKVAPKKAAKPAKKAPAKKVAPKKAAKPAKKAIAKKPVKKVAPKKAAKPVKKVVAKTPVKKVVAKKNTPKKVVKPVKKVVAKKIVKPAKKVVAKKIVKPAKKVVVKKATKPVKAAVKPVQKVVAKAVVKPIAKVEVKKAVVIAKPVVVAKPIVKKAEAASKKKHDHLDLDDDGRGGDYEPMIVEYKTPSIHRPMGPVPTPHINTDKRTRYSDSELKEFKELILKKLAEAQKDYELLKSTLSHKDDHGTDDTSPTFKLLEDGSDVLSKEETSHLAGRQEKFIQNLQNALIRIENKTYGICRVTGKLISKERLKSVPHATLAIEAKLEQNA